MASATQEPARKMALLLDLARLQDNLGGGSLDQALELCREAAAVGFEPQRALDELERLAEAAGKPEELIRALDLRYQALVNRAREVSIAERLTLNDEIVGLRRRQAQLARAQGDGQRAWDFLQSAVELRPDEPLILRDLVDLGESLGRWTELAQLYVRRAAENAPEAFRTALQLERAAGAPARDPDHRRGGAGERGSGQGPRPPRVAGGAGAGGDGCRRLDAPGRALRLGGGAGARHHRTHRGRRPSLGGGRVDGGRHGPRGAPRQRRRSGAPAHRRALRRERLSAGSGRAGAHSTCAPASTPSTRRSW